MKTPGFKTHIIHEQRGMLAQPILQGVPRVGDQIRIREGVYMQVTLVVWVLDEPECPLQRVNIGVIEAPEEDAP